MNKMKTCIACFDHNQESGKIRGLCDIHINAERIHEQNGRMKEFIKRISKDDWEDNECLAEEAQAIRAEVRK